MKGKILGFESGISIDGEHFTRVDIELMGRLYTREQMLAMIGTEVEVFAGDWVYRDGHSPAPPLETEQEWDNRRNRLGRDL